MEGHLLLYVHHTHYHTGCMLTSLLRVGFWMSDKPLVQQALATEIAEILLTITDLSVSLDFLRGFWETTVREWNNIDRLR